MTVPYIKTTERVYAECMGKSSGPYLTDVAANLYLASGDTVPQVCGSVAGTAQHPPIRIAHLGPCFLRGGAEQQALDLAKALEPSRARIETFLVTHPELIEPAKVAAAGVPVVVADAETIRQAANEYDILLFWGVELDRYLDGSARKARTVCIAHGVGAWVDNLLMASVHSTDHVVAVSELVRASLCCNLPVTLIRNGVDAKRLAASRPRRQVRCTLGFSDDDFVTGFVGRLAPEKQPDLLIRAVHLLPPQHKALLVGTGPLESDLLRLANRLIPGRYAFTCVDDYLGDVYSAMDCFSLSSATEGFALVLLEAMLLGKPVVTTNVGGAPELIRHRQTGVLVEPTPQSIAEAIADVANLPQWAQGMAATAARVADEVGHASQMARQYEDLFARLL